jgi:tripartite-type tricarboxylate transporter receptor subunit TctC
MRKLLGIVLCLNGGLGMVHSASAQPAANYPNAPVRVIVPHAPGGTSDMLSRAITQKLHERWGQPVIVDTRPGANGIVGLDLAARSAPDGYTLVIAESVTLTVNPSLNADLPFKPERDFAPITRVTSYGTLLLAHPSVPANTVKEFLDLARAKPSDLSYGSFGIGSGGHLAMEALKLLAGGVDITHVVYRGSAPVQTDLIAGRISSTLISVSSGKPHMEAGKVKALGFANPTRSPLVPNVPTFAEQGVDFEATTSFVMMAPAKVPAEIIRKINADVVAIIQNPEFTERWYTQRGLEAKTDTPEELGAYMKAQTALWAKVIKDAGIKLE